ncbi:hypothetical protein Mapa_012186 [Marchantia paleacea]|nr:hypothetical protein Mapa_012186 [Marchantia paleacea]
MVNSKMFGLLHKTLRSRRKNSMKSHYRVVKTPEKTNFGDTHNTSKSIFALDVSCWKDSKDESSVRVFDDKEIMMYHQSDICTRLACTCLNIPCTSDGEFIFLCMRVDFVQSC